ncbi:TetR family transcriptional regulator [Bacillus cereus]|nr:TetR family transcriptional regulator [Bacillus cereus]
MIRYIELSFDKFYKKLISAIRLIQKISHLITDEIWKVKTSISQQKTLPPQMKW